LTRISDANTESPESTQIKYQQAKQRVSSSLEFLRLTLTEAQNDVLSRLLEDVETCTEMEWNGAFSSGYDMGLMSAEEDAES
jgi:RecG-like helicase